MSIAGPFKFVALLIARATTLAYPELLPELVSRLERVSMKVVLLVLDHEGDADAGLAQALQIPLDGIICAVPPSEAALQEVLRRGIPLLLYNCFSQHPPVDSVSCDHAACGRVLAKLLLDGGHRRFGVISATDDSLVSVERVAGAVDTLRRHRALAIEIAAGDYSYESGAAALDALFGRMKPRPSAIIAANDAMAIGALDRARDLKVRIPRDLSVVGIDGITAAGLPSYQLTTMRQPLARMADAAVETLCGRMNAPQRAPEIRLFAGELIVGKTARLERPQPRRAAAE